MIARLSGRVDGTGTDWAIVDVGGVGYRVSCSARTLARLGPDGSAVRLDVETQVREDAITLYGFAESAERDWFRMLLTVQGVGAKVALSILGSLAPEDLIRAIAAQDRAALTVADGVGPKLASRILAELKDKAGGMALGPAARNGAAMPAANGAGDGGAAAEAVSALVNLGYRRAEAFGAVADIVARNGGAAPPLAELIRLGLKELSA